MLAAPELLQERAQECQLAAVLPRYFRDVPLYSGVRNPISEDDCDFKRDHFQKVPLITKRDIQENFPRNFLRGGADLENLLSQELVELEYTSGTSEERTPLLLGACWWAEQEKRALFLNSFVAETLAENPEARRVTIVSPSCSNDISYAGVPSCGERTLGNARFVTLSRFPFLWSERDLSRMIAEAVEWNPVFLDVDPVYAVPFALYCERHMIRFPSLKFVIASYEFLSVVHRRILQRVFQVPVFNLYGSTETGHLLMESERGELRPSLETAFLEVIDVDSRGIGSLVVTTLTNDFMPLVRYAIGDLVRRIERPYGTRYEMHGRAADCIHSQGSFRRVTVLDLDQCFDEITGIAHYQMDEPAPGQFRLRYVPEPQGPGAEALNGLRARLGNLLGEGAVSVQTTPGLLAERSGKFRLLHPRKDQAHA